MRIIETRSFKLAINTKGDEYSDRIALVLPGRLDTKDYLNSTSHIDFLARLGFYAISFDPPGTWDSPGGINLFNTTNYIKATNELVEYFCNNKNTLLMGHSRGGTVSILSGTSNTNVKAIIAVMASYGDPTLPNKEAIKIGYKVSYRDLPPGDHKTNKQIEFKIPISYFQDGEQYNAGEVLKKCNKPKLLIYGLHDEFTDPEVVKEEYNVIPDPKMIYELDCEHDYRYDNMAIKQVNKIMKRFLDKYF